MNFKDIVIADIYGTIEGFAQYLSSILVPRGYKGNIHTFAIPNVFVKHGSIDEQLKSLSLDIESLDKLISDIKNEN
jgi:deoxyxylulose-5-phosphate synthase